MGAYYCHSCGGVSGINCPDCIICVIKECEEYLSRNDRNYIGHGSKLHMKMQEAIEGCKIYELKLRDNITKRTVNQ